MPAVAGGDARCERIEAGLLEIDGMLDDWGGVRPTRVGGTDADASYDLRCAYDGRALYLSVNVRDERLIRDRKPNPRAQDNLRIKLRAGRGARPLALVVFPASDRHGPRRLVAGKKPPRWLKVEDTQQPRGWSVEVVVPRARIAGLAANAPGVQAKIEYHDADQAAEGRIQEVRRFTGTLQMAATADLLASFLQQTGLTSRQVRVDVMANVDDVDGAERVVAAGKLIAVLSDGFSFIELPVQSAADVQKVQVVDLRGDGTSSIIAEYRQHGGGGSRDVVAVYQVTGSGFARALAFEVRKQMGESVLTNRWWLAPSGKFRRGKRRARGRDIVVRAEQPVGWDEDSYNEVPAADVKPILLPWEDQRSAVYYFEGTALLGGEPIAGARRRR